MQFLLSFLLAVQAATAVTALPSGASALSDVTHNLHKRAVKHSAGLARNIRRAFSNGTLHDRATTQSKTKRTTCKVKTSSGSSASLTSSAAPQSGTPAAAAAAKPSPSSWKLLQAYQGQSFFDGWSFFTESDPTGGTVDYLSRGDAQSANLIEINSAGHAIMSVDTTQHVTNGRKSVRIQSQQSYTFGLVLLDAYHMPTGCGTWPAFWSNGPNWPNGGEIDIVEGVNTGATNQATIHTANGCSMSSWSPSALGITGTVGKDSNCFAYNDNNSGCGITDESDNSYGVGFNNNNGGVYAMQWVDSGISVWFFPRNSIPSDITAGQPTPESWQKPFAHWPSTDCNMSQFFYQHSAIFDTTLCGQWAGNVWGETCKASTGVDTCMDYVLNHGDQFKEAYWEVGYVKIFQKD